MLFINSVLWEISICTYIMTILNDIYLAREKTLTKISFMTKFYPLVSLPNS